ncbi:MAG: type II toxin-antitoxin system Phd/YefM family antitoxin [Terriglobales bacterium]
MVFRPSGIIELVNNDQSEATMREIAASEAKTHLLRLLDEVEQGETIIITRHGKRIACLEPAGKRQDEIAGAITRIRQLAKQRREEYGPVSVEEILSARDAGRKY